MEYKNQYKMFITNNKYLYGCDINEWFMAYEYADLESFFNDFERVRNECAEKGIAPLKIEESANIKGGWLEYTKYTFKIGDMEVSFRSIEYFEGV